MKPFSCSMCDKTFRKSATLKVHDRIHTAEKPFSCSKCNKTFRKSGSLERHERVQTGGKPFSCSLTKSSLKHIFWRLIKESIFWKRLLGRNTSVKWLSYFQIHLDKRIHTDKKPFSCKRCKKTRKNPHQWETIQLRQCDYKCSTSGSLRSM